jgi:putative CocE/NonD family hydrolase
MGPWTHWGIASGLVGDMDFGPAATLDIQTLRADWFGHWLHDRATGVTDRPKVRIFVMGENVWRDEDEWPLERTQWTSWYLQSGGLLTDELPSASAPDAFTYDPRNPVPTRGGRLLGDNAGARGGPIEQGDLVSRPDVLAYTSEALPDVLEITGPVRAELWVSSTAPDTDFTAKLVDVHPDGRSFNISEGIVRAGTAIVNRLQPGAVYQVPIDVGATSILVPAGHRLQVLVSSSSWPMWEPNANTGNAPGTDTDDDLRTADQLVFHDPAHPSRVVLPVIPR